MYVRIINPRRGSILPGNTERYAVHTYTHSWCALKILTKLDKQSLTDAYILYILCAYITIRKVVTFCANTIRDGTLGVAAWKKRLMKKSQEQEW